MTARRLAPVAFVLLGCLVAPVAGADEDDRPLGRSVDPLQRTKLEAEGMVEKGLAYLAEQLRQKMDGSYPSDPQRGKDPALANVAIGALAFMSAGYTADHGPYLHEVRRSIRWILDHARPGACSLCEGKEPHEWVFIRGHNDNISRMHGHGYAVWALAMAYGMSFGERNEQDRQELRRSLQAAVHCIEMAQTDTGGWGYEEHRGTFHEGSVTITVLQALRAAHDAGISVDKAVIDGAVEYIRKSQVRNGPSEGGFRYQLGDPNTTFSLTAAAISSLNQTGIYDSRWIDLGIDYMQQHDPFFNLKNEAWPAYSRLYATQAYWQYRNLRHFTRYYPEVVARLKAEQSDDGAFRTDSQYHVAYYTAMGALTLSVPFGYLPSFQR